MTTTVVTHQDHDCPPQSIRVLIVSGRSGSGKTSALNSLEDLGYYAIDNLPLTLLVDTARALTQDSGICKIALGVDIRSPKADLSHFDRIFAKLIDRYGRDQVNVVYLIAQDSTLVARFNATRRVHPLMATLKTASPHADNLPAALNKEADLLEPIANRADMVIDTSKINIHELKSTLREYLGADNKVMVNILSFGFKYGSPIDADFVFDVRILPNPHWQPELRAVSGQDDSVAAFFDNYPEVAQMSGDITQFMTRWLPAFLNNNRHTVTIAIGCTGGKHRSVFISERLGAALSDALPDNLVITVKHREKQRW